MSHITTMSHITIMILTLYIYICIYISLYLSISLSIYLSLLFVGEIPENFPPAFDERTRWIRRSRMAAALWQRRHVAHGKPWGPEVTLWSFHRCFFICFPCFFYMFSYGKWNISAFSSIFFSILSTIFWEDIRLFFQSFREFFPLNPRKSKKQQFFKQKS